MDTVRAPGGAMVYRRRNPVANIHTYVEPSLGNATHVIEGPNSLVLVDAQYFSSSARDFRRYVDSLGKPIALMMVSHDHPDHYFGLSAAFNDVPSAALPEVAQDIKAKGPETLKAIKQIMDPGLFPDSVTYPHRFLQPGKWQYDGVDYDFQVVKNGEDEVQLVIDLPQLDSLILQDLAYNGYHAYLFGSNEEDPRAWNPRNWLTTLRKYSTLGRNYILVGHGPPANSDIFITNIKYLLAVNGLLGYVKNSEEYARLLFYLYPDLKGRNIVDMYSRFLRQKLA